MCSVWQGIPQKMIAAKSMNVGTTVSKENEQMSAHIQMDVELHPLVYDVFSIQIQNNIPKKMLSEVNTDLLYANEYICVSGVSGLLVHPSFV